MQQKWWLVAAGVVGLALAILLFPKPQTSDLPDPDQGRANPTDFKAAEADGGEAPKTTKRQIKVGTRELRRPEDLRADIARMNGKGYLTQPESIYSGRLSGPWTLVRRQMLANGDEAAKAWAEQLTPLVMDLRARRRDPQAADWNELRERQEALLEQVLAEPDWVAIDGVADQLDRITEIFETYDAERSAADPGDEAPTQGN